jgi:hypothetical protein
MTLEERFGSAERPQLHLRRRRQQRLPLAHAHRRTARSALHRGHARAASPQARDHHKAIEMPSTGGSHHACSTIHIKAAAAPTRIYTDVCVQHGLHQARRSYTLPGLHQHGLSSMHCHQARNAESRSRRPQSPGQAENRCTRRKALITASCCLGGRQANSSCTVPRAPQRRSHMTCP